MQEARVLIMDDEVKERQRIEEFLTNKGHDAHAVGSIHDAIDAIKRERFDVFLKYLNT